METVDNRSKFNNRGVLIGNAISSLRMPIRSGESPERIELADDRPRLFVMASLPVLEIALVIKITNNCSMSITTIAQNTVSRFLLDVEIA